MQMVIITLKILNLEKKKKKKKKKEKKPFKVGYKHSNLSLLDLYFGC